MNAAKLMKAIAKFLIATILVQLGIWLFLWINALNTINESMDVLVGKVTEANCIDGPTGEYDDMTSILLRTNLENPFFQYPIHISSYSRVESAGSDLYKYNIVDGTRNGNDGFTVKKSDGKTVDKDTKDKKNKKLKKVITTTVISAVIGIPILRGAVSLFDNVSDSINNSKAIRVARLDEDGLTSDAMLTQQEFSERITSGVLPNASTSGDTLVVCDKLKDDVLNAFWMEQSMSIESNRALTMATVTGIYTVNSSLDAKEVADTFFRLYENTDEYRNTFDRLLVSVNGRIFEHSRLRLEGGLNQAELTLPEDASSNTEITDRISLDGLTELSDSQITEYYYDGINYLLFEKDECSSVDNLLNDYFYLFNELYRVVGETPKISVVLRIECGDSSIVILVDAFKAYEYGYNIGELDALAQYGYVMQFHDVYALIAGSARATLDSLYYGLLG